MASFVGYRDGGKTNEEGLKKEMTRLFTQGCPVTDTPTSLQVVQRGGGANMSVDVSIGDAHIYALSMAYSYWGWIDAIANVTIVTADPTNPRIDAIVAYIDLAVVSSASNNNPGALKFSAVAGTAAGSPAAPSDATITTAMGTNPWIRLANVTVGAAVSSIVTGVVSDTRPVIALRVQASSSVASGYNNLTVPPTTVVCNGNHSQSLTFNGQDLTTILSPGMRIRTTRTVAAPTQCTNLNGTTQFWNRASVTGMTFTDDFVVSAWIKLTAYQSYQTIVSRYNGTSGWSFSINSDGTPELVGFNGGGANNSKVKSILSVPLNKWIHVTAQLDMSTFTPTTTTSYIMFDGIDTPAAVSRTGTNPIALIQAGNLEIGTQNAASFFPGKLAQVAIFSAKVAQSTMQGYISQGLIGTETNLASAYAFNGNGNDLNTTNANNLTGQGSAVATNADSPFGSQASGLISSTLDYGIVQKVTFSTNTTVVVQVAEGCTIPTSGGVSAIAYSGNRAPYGFPAQKGKWSLQTLLVPQTVSTIGTGTWSNVGSQNITVPIGEWDLSYQNSAAANSGGTNSILFTTLSTTTTTETNIEFTAESFVNVAEILGRPAYKKRPVSAATQTVYYLLLKQTSAAGANIYAVIDSPSLIELENAYL